jgi:hypothetical protein
MVGVITGWDILAHPAVTIRCFGWRVFFKAVAPWQGRTFLSLVQPAASSRPVTANVPTILERCISLELRAKQIYIILSRAFRGHGPAGRFFAGLAEQEQYHADLLELCRTTALQCGWKANIFNPWETYLPRLEQEMAAAEAAVREVDSLDAALRLVIQIESSEVNSVFRAALAATDAKFVKRLKLFRKTMEAHMTYIVERLPELSPNLMLACRELRARYLYAKA